ncbi:MAG: hypothetical protein P8K08_26100 [Fuerstiella sp.]|nr:hypothetical protein [Fuerstiella sp.]
MLYSKDETPPPGRDAGQLETGTMNGAASMWQTTSGADLGVLNGALCR